MINVDFKSVIELVHAYPNEDICVKHLEQLRWPNKVISPFDSTSKVYKCAGYNYKCKNTGKYFNVKTGTMFDNTKVDLQSWFIAIYYLTGHKKGMSSVQLSDEINVTQKTAWFMMQRIRACFGLDEVKPDMDGIVQLDETFVGGKNKNRHKDKKVENCQGRSFKDKTPVAGMLSNGKVKAFVVPNTQANILQPLIKKYIPFGTSIVSDEWKGYRGLAKFYHHEVVDHVRGQYVNDCNFTTNALEGFWSHLKRGIIGVYHYTSKKHLQKYVDEFCFRYNNRDMSISERFVYTLTHCNNRLTYKALIA